MKEKAVPTANWDYGQSGITFGKLKIQTRTQSVIGVNPEGSGVATPPDFGMGLHEILLYPTMYTVQEYEMRTLYKVVTFQKWKDLCILNKISGDGTLNPVLYASVGWTFRQG